MLELWRVLCYFFSCGGVLRRILPVLIAFLVLRVSRKLPCVLSRLRPSAVPPLRQTWKSPTAWCARFGSRGGLLQVFESLWGSIALLLVNMDMAERAVSMLMPLEALVAFGYIIFCNRRNSLSVGWVFPHSPVRMPPPEKLSRSPKTPRRVRTRAVGHPAVGPVEAGGRAPFRVSDAQLVAGLRVFLSSMCSSR